MAEAAYRADVFPHIVHHDTIVGPQAYVAGSRMKVWYLVSAADMTERARDIRKKAKEATDEAASRWHETGELSHLYGKPLDLTDDPNWLATRVLKQIGFSHPLIERSKELDAPREAAERVADRLRRRYTGLSRADSRPTISEIGGFNRWRREALEEYREKLRAVNAAIRDYNLQAPEALHQRPIVIEDAVPRLAQDVPEIELPATPKAGPAPRRRFRLRAAGKVRS